MQEDREACPDCRAGAAYRLGDGRRKCRHCGQRYSLRRRRSRLPATELRQLALCFWQMVPAREAARVVGVNRKTVHRHYALLRREIGGNVWEIPEEAWSEGAEQPLAALIVDGKEIRAVAGAKGDCDEEVCALVYRGERVPVMKGGLDDLRLWLPEGGVGDGVADVIVKFWGFVGRMARFYRRRDLVELPLILQEVAFRLNRRDDPQVIATLCRLLEG